MMYYLLSSSAMKSSYTSSVMYLFWTEYKLGAFEKLANDRCPSRFLRQYGSNFASQSW